MGVIITLIGLRQLRPSLIAGTVLGIVYGNNLSKLVYSRKGLQHQIFITHHRLCIHVDVYVSFHLELKGKDPNRLCDQN